MIRDNAIRTPASSEKIFYFISEYPRSNIISQTVLFLYVSLSKGENISTEYDAMVAMDVTLKLQDNMQGELFPSWTESF